MRDKAYFHVFNIENRVQRSLLPIKFYGGSKSFAAFVGLDLLNPKMVLIRRFVIK
ncbi:protein of unknown function [Methylotuvimicrobium alcaliphilum 20Z]|uniref:Uncharacterized protein n=1 Tax=Methylotuvimicrobium alcaliphilum (strain DSM 19304 / NCIMB 14124 / VKM B-2133 / 20Z) TaxID=1091494 RepID=G4SWP3_META2|nr:protein of unknown function [Methylotuvimicrobium alcaliphilum 20Z]